MPKAVTMYRANDGSLWKTFAEAEAREQLVAAIKAALAPLGKRPNDTGQRFTSGGGYRQHDPEVVMKVKVDLIKASRLAIGDWVEQQECGGTPLSEIDPACFGRVAEDSGFSPLASAWGRLACIGSDGREWGQPYFVQHPDCAKQVAV